MTRDGILDMGSSYPEKNKQNKIKGIVMSTYLVTTTLSARLNFPSDTNHSGFAWRMPAMGPNSFGFEYIFTKNAHEEPPPHHPFN